MIWADDPQRQRSRSLSEKGRRYEKAMREGLVRDAQDHPEQVAVDVRGRQRMGERAWNQRRPLNKMENGLSLIGGSFFRQEK